jgi:hypothetical protein
MQSSAHLHDDILGTHPRGHACVHAHGDDAPVIVIAGGAGTTNIRSLRALCAQTSLAGAAVRRQREWHSQALGASEGLFGPVESFQFAHSVVQTPAPRQRVVFEFLPTIQDAFPPAVAYTVRRHVAFIYRFSICLALSRSHSARSDSASCVFWSNTFLMVSAYRFPNPLPHKGLRRISLPLKTLRCMVGSTVFHRSREKEPKS